MSETPARDVMESDREKAKTIAKLCWYTGKRSVETLAWYLEIDEDEVESIIGSDEHLAEIEKLIRTRPNRKLESIEEWWAKHWKHNPSGFAKRVRLSEKAAEELIERVLRSL